MIFIRNFVIINNYEYQKRSLSVERVEKLYLLHGKLSPALLQRKLRITFKHASKLLSDFNLKYFTKNDPTK